MSDTKCATVYTDGSCKPNPGAGGWGFISLTSTGDWYMSGGDSYTTNNRMELLAIIEAIRFHAKSSHIKIYTDSKYCEKCARGEWQRKKNKDLWAEYDEASRRMKITLIKVKAHNGDKYNELVDKLAKSAVPEKAKK